MILHDELIYLLEHRYPKLKHGRDFWVAQKINPQTGEQLADAEILQWPPEIEPPDTAELIKSFGVLKDAFLAKQARAMRDALIAKTDGTASGGYPASDTGALAALSTSAARCATAGRLSGLD